MREEEKKTSSAALKKETSGEERDYVSEVAKLLENYPELKGKTIPEEVVLSALDGKDLIAAYEEYLEERGFAEEEDDADRFRHQKKRSAGRSPVRGVSGGSAVTVQGEDDFLRGFNAVDSTY